MSGGIGCGEGWSYFAPFLALHRSPSKKFLGKVLAKKSKILAGGQDLARRLRSCHILGKILAKILARNWPAIILAPWARSWASLGQVGQDLGQESCPRTFCWVQQSH